MKILLEVRNTPEDPSREGMISETKVMKEMLEGLEGPLIQQSDCGGSYWPIWDLLARDRERQQGTVKGSKARHGSRFRVARRAANAWNAWNTWNSPT